MGAWNPLTATGTSLAEARRLADDALHGIRLALREADFVDGKLAHLLLVHELRRSVDRAFGAVPVCSAHQQGGAPVPGNPYAGGGNPYAGGGGAPSGGGHGGGGGGFGGVPSPQPPQRRGFWAGCGMFSLLCCTCQLCCAKEYEGPWSRKKREGCCRDCDCCEACECCGCDC